jgi:uncharacterized membrane protein YkoI
MRYAELLLLSVLSTGPTNVLARGSSEPVTRGESQQLSKSEETTSEREIRRFADARISIQRAIHIAESRSAVGKAVDVSFDGQTERAAYRVKIYRRNEVWQCTVDASTGELFGASVVTPVSKLDAKDKIEIAHFRTAGLHLSEAVPIAEEYGHGKAVSAGLEEANGRLLFLVVLVVDGALKQISVAPSQVKIRRPGRK